jgi:hypothetical protein
MTITTKARTARRQADLVSVKALGELLRSVASSPVTHSKNESLLSALRSQGALAKYSDDTLSICGMSLNHQRLIAESALGGYEVLDHLRRAALESVLNYTARSARANKSTKSGLSARVKELEAELSLFKQDMAILQRAYDMRCVQARNYASTASASVQALCAKEQRELDATFSLRRRSTPSSNVVSLETSRDRARDNV